MPPSPLSVAALSVTAPRVAVLAAAAVLAGCSQPARVGTAPPPASSSAVRTTPQPTSRPTATAPARTATGTPAPVFVERTATPCGGYPTGEQIIALLRRTSGFFPAAAPVTVRTGPLCAGSWQYTVVIVPERDPLQVVTKGTPSSLQLVTAGTDVCTVEVRAVAPAGIREITRC